MVSKIPRGVDSLGRQKYQILSCLHSNKEKQELDRGYERHEWEMGNGH